MNSFLGGKHFSIQGLHHALQGPTRKNKLSSDLVLNLSRFLVPCFASILSNNLSGHPKTILVRSRRLDHPPPLLSHLGSAADPRPSPLPNGPRKPKGARPQPHLILLPRLIVSIPQLYRPPPHQPVPDRPRPILLHCLQEGWGI